MPGLNWLSRRSPSAPTPRLSCQAIARVDNLSTTRPSCCQLKSHRKSRPLSRSEIQVCKDPRFPLLISHPYCESISRLADREITQDNGQSFANIPAGAGKIYCNPLDNICQNGYLITAFHYSYATQYVPAAAGFVASKLPQK